MSWPGSQLAGPAPNLSPASSASSRLAVLRVENLDKRFGGVRAINDVSLEIERGTITGLIGPNGAGKTTLFNIIAGAYPPTSGRVLLEGLDITSAPPHERYRLGLLRTFQIAHEFSSLTVEENLMAAAADQDGRTAPWRLAEARNGPPAGSSCSQPGTGGSRISATR